MGNEIVKTDNKKVKRNEQIKVIQDYENKKVSDLTEEELILFMKKRNMDKLAVEIGTMANAGKWPEWVKAFLSQWEPAGPGGWKLKTTITYFNSLAIFSKFSASHGIDPATLKPKDTTRLLNMILHNEGTPRNYSRNTFLLVKRAVSSMQSFLLVNEFIDNRFFISQREKKTAARLDANQRQKALSLQEKKKDSSDGYPTIREIMKLEKEAGERSRKDRLAVTVLRVLALRVGALPTLKIENGVWTAISKGKAIGGKLPAELSGLSQEPFKDFSIDAFCAWMGRATKRMGRKYFPHAIRHRVALNLYNKTKDIYAVKILLCHSSVMVTENYLKEKGVFND